MLHVIGPLATPEGSESSNPPLSTIQSVNFCTSRRIARNPRVCAASLGATVGDLLDKPHANGGLSLSRRLLGGPAHQGKISAPRI